MDLLCAPCCPFSHLPIFDDKLDLHLHTCKFVLDGDPAWTTNTSIDGIFGIDLCACATTAFPAYA